MYTSRSRGVLVLCSALALVGCGIEGPHAGQESRDAAERGSSRPDDATPQAIKGGVEATGYPEAVLVNMKKGGWHVASCSGTVIAPRVVLTAGHCVVGGYDGFDVYAPYAGAGQWASSTKALTYDWTDNGNSVNPNQHDIGLVVLDGDIVIGHYPAIASQPVAAGTKIVNIGRKQDGALSSSQLFVSLPTPVNSGSSYGFPFDYAATEIIEPGDSGGPDMLPGPAPRTIVAVNSGTGNGWEILARVDLLHGWIGEQVAANGGSNPPPEVDPIACAHPLCEQAGALDATCDPCAQQICAQDPYCCTTSWDGQCVSEVASICGGSCQPPDPPPDDADPCGGLTYEGECNGATLSWCDNDQIHTIDCAQSGKQCGWDSSSSYYDCL